MIQSSRQLMSDIYFKLETAKTALLNSLNEEERE